MQVNVAAMKRTLVGLFPTHGGQQLARALDADLLDHRAEARLTLTDRAIRPATMR